MVLEVSHCIKCAQYIIRLFGAKLKVEFIYNTK